MVKQPVVAFSHFATARLHEPVMQLARVAGRAGNSGGGNGKVLKLTFLGGVSGRSAIGAEPTVASESQLSTPIVDGVFD
jgi:hypothetical protein